MKKNKTKFIYLTLMIGTSLALGIIILGGMLSLYLPFTISFLKLTITAKSILLTGIILLMLTPLLVNLITAYYFFKSHQNAYSLVTILVAIIVIISIIIGFFYHR